MYCKIFNHGTGKSGGIDYLLSTKDSDNKVRSVAPKIMRGDIENMKALIDTLSFKQKYTSGVLSFEESNIDEKLKSKLIDDFEKMVFPTLEKNQYSSFWVEHRDKGRLEMHFVFANVELLSGKTLKPFWKNQDQKRFHQFQEITNFDNGFSSVMEPERRKTINFSSKLGKDNKSLVEELKKAIQTEVENGKINNRNDVIEFIKSVGIEITRTNKKSLSIKAPEFKKAVRLKGIYYDENFTDIGKIASEIKTESARYKESLPQRIAEFRIEFDSRIKSKSAYNLKRYGEPTPGVEKVLEQTTSISKKHDQEIQFNLVPTFDWSSFNNSGRGLSDKNRNNEISPVAKREDPTIERDRELASRNNDYYVRREQEKLLRTSRPRTSISGWLEKIKIQIRELNERIKSAITQQLGRIEQSIKQRNQSFDQQSAKISSNLENAIRTTTNAVDANQGIEQTISTTSTLNNSLKRIIEGVNDQVKHTIKMIDIKNQPEPKAEIKNNGPELRPFGM